MQLVQTDLAGGILKVKFIGALDIAGAGDVEMPLAVISGSKEKVIVDFSGLTFLASIGIRVLVKAARAITGRKGRLVICNCPEDARKVLRSTGIDSIIPVVADEAAAIAEISK